MRRIGIFVLACCLLSPLAANAQKAAPSPEEALLQSKCALCHSAHRIYDADPSKLKQLVDKMEQKNPEWFKGADKGHLVEAIATILKDPKITARRKVWEETVAEGKALFSDVSLGKNGQSCASCHTTESFRNNRDAFPRFDQARGRFLNLQETINLMIVDRLEGAALPLGDPREVALEVYLKTLL